jgi:hypothetical protein
VRGEGVSVISTDTPDKVTTIPIEALENGVFDYNGPLYFTPDDALVVGSILSDGPDSVLYVVEVGGLRRQSLKFSGRD